MIVDLQSCGDEVVTYLDYVTTLFFGMVAGIGKNIRNRCHFCQPLKEAPLRSGPLLLESGQAVSRLRFNYRGPYSEVVFSRRIRCFRLSLDVDVVATI